MAPKKRAGEESERRIETRRIINKFSYSELEEDEGNFFLLIFIVYFSLYFFPFVYSFLFFSPLSYNKPIIEDFLAF